MAYQPATNLTTSAGLAHLAAVFYKKKALDRLQKKFVFQTACTKDLLPKQSGRTVQWFRFSNFNVSTTEKTEGTVGSGLSLTSKVITATVSQYAAFLTVSDMVKDTAIDPIVQHAAELLGYQAGLNVDTITRSIIDAEESSTEQALLATYLRVADLRNCKSQLSAADVQPFDNNEFKVFAHPYVTFDLVNDPNAGGLADIVKYTSPQTSALVRYEDRGTVTHVAGCEVIESTNVNIDDVNPDEYRVYVFGANGVGCVNLAGRGPSDIRDPRKQRFAVNIIPGAPSIADPEGIIGAAVSYNFAFVVSVLDGPTGIGGVYRFKTMEAQSTIG